MAKLEILKFPDPRLRKLSLPVEKVDDEVQSYLDDMLETMYSFNGIGLAAPQVNRLQRMIVIDTRVKEDNDRYDQEKMTELEKKIEQPLFLINPEIVKKEGKTTYDEGCLSVPSYYETVERFDYIEINAMDKFGNPIRVKADGLLSICIQHEIDHLDGKLFIDHLSVVKSGKIKKQIKKHGYPDPKDDKEDEDAAE